MNILFNNRSPTQLLFLVILGFINTQLKVLGEEFTGTTLYMSDGEIIDVHCIPDERGQLNLDLQTDVSGSNYYNLTCVNPAREDWSENVDSIKYENSSLYMNHSDSIRALCDPEQGGQLQLELQQGWYTLACYNPVSGEY